MSRTHRTLRRLGNALQALTLALVLLACDRRPADREQPSRRNTLYAPRYYTVPEQLQIEEAANELWSRTCLNQTWQAASERILAACGGRFRFDEAFLLASYHPRAFTNASWRGEFHEAVRLHFRPEWRPSSDPVCKLIHDAVEPEPSRVGREALAERDDP